MTKYFIFCDYCGWKVISDLKNLEIYSINNDTLSNKKYRCQNCGRAARCNKIKDPQKELEKKLQEEKNSKETEDWIRQNIDFQVNFLNEEQDEQ